MFLSLNSGGNNVHSASSLWQVQGTYITHNTLSGVFQVLKINDTILTAVKDWWPHSEGYNTSK